MTLFHIAIKMEESPNEENACLYAVLALPNRINTFIEQDSLKLTSINLELKKRLTKLILGRLYCSHRSQKGFFRMKFELG